MKTEERDELGRNRRCRARLAAKDKAEPVIALAQHISAQLATPNERRGFWSKLKREVIKLRAMTLENDKRLQSRSDK